MAAGSSRRMKGLDKLFAPLGGKPLLAHAVEAVHACRAVGEVVLVLSAHNLELGRRLAEEMGWSKVRALCLGGPRRQDSVRLGLEHLGDVEWVVVHDGARPLATPEMVCQGLEEARETGAACAAVPVKDTIKVVSRDMTVAETPSRDRLWAVQTPQVFRRSLLEEAHRRIDDEVTDDATMVERLGVRVKLFPGSYSNIKVTTPEDLLLAEALLAHQEAHR